VSEYGNTVGEVGGRVAGSNGMGGSGVGDWGAQIGQMVSDTAHNASTMPPGQLLLLVVVIIAGLFVLKRAF
jgi:hypothetical protein